MSAPGRHHTIHGACHHWHWSRDIAPVVHAAPGDRIALELNDPGGGQIGKSSSADILPGLDFERVNPVTGPIFVDGAEPGDAMTIEVLDIVPCDWGWTALIPDFGLLAADFPDPALHIWELDRRCTSSATLGTAGAVPLRPMIGSLGLAPAAPGRHDILPPRRVGGTMDIRDLVPGTTLMLPVEVAGGLLSAGDGHAAQGDGEVCGTGIETALSAELKIDLVKDMPLSGPRLSLTAPATAHIDHAGYDATTAIGTDLMSATRDAVRGMIDLLCAREAMAPEDAYMLCSVCADLRISEIVNRPNWIVSLYFPRAVLA